MTDGLSTDFMVTAQIRIAAKEGIPMIVVRRGHAHSGTIFLKLNLLNGTARVLSQVRYNDELVWAPVSRTDPMPEADAEKYLERQMNIDPDIWILEIEDRQGRHFFPGKIVA